MTSFESIDPVPDRVCDLHVHSNKSDGSCTPSEIIDLAVERHISAIALTDHDCVAGLEEFNAHAAGRPIETVNGIELSTGLNGKDIHILGLFIDPDDQEFLDYLVTFRKSRDDRNVKMCELLHKGLHMDISYDALKEMFPGAVITRGHFAKYMYNKGIVRSLREPFERWIGDSKPYFLPRERITPEGGVRLILSAHGVPILAHPILYGFGREKLEQLVKKLKDSGLAGIEAIYTTYERSDEMQICDMADRYGLLLSGGSDYHGTNKINTELGIGRGNLRVPYDIYDRMRKYHDDQNK